LRQVTQFLFNFLKDESSVSTDEAQVLAKKPAVKFLDTSALSGENVKASLGETVPAVQRMILGLDEGGCCTTYEFALRSVIDAVEALGFCRGIRDLPEAVKKCNSSICCCREMTEACLRPKDVNDHEIRSLQLS
jgi:hypothetical protein